MIIEEELSHKIRGCVFEVYRELGSGFLENVYEKALLKELRLQGIDAKSQVEFDVRYKGEIVGKYYADVVVENRIILELKAQASLSKAFTAQLLNYLAVSGLRVGFLINFTYPRATVTRIIR